MGRPARSLKHSRAGKIFSFVLVFMFMPMVSSGLDISSPVIRDHADLDGLTTGDDHTQYQKESEKDGANGYAGLDGSGDIALGALPNHASNHTDGTDDLQDATAAQKGLATSTQIAKLDGIETSATADQTASEIKTAYESNTNTNEFDDTEQSKLAGIETAAKDDQTLAEVLSTGNSTGGTNLQFSGTDKMLGSLGNVVLQLFDTASAVNFIGLTSEVAGSGPTIAPVGTDVDIDLEINGKGTGQVNVGALLTTVANAPKVVRTAASNNTTALGLAHKYAVTDTTVARTITVSSADILSTDREFIIKDESGGAGTFNITIATEGAQTIDGVSTVIITVDFGSVSLYSDGTNLFSY